MQNNTQFTELLSLKKTSETLKVHPNTLRQWDKKGILKAIRFGDRKDRHYKKEDILKFLEGKFSDLDIPEDQQNYHYQSFVERKTIAEQALEKLNCIQNIASALSRTLTTNEVFELFLDHLKSALKAERVAVFQINKQTKKLACLANSGFSKDYIDETQQIPSNGKSLYLDVLHTGEPLFIDAYEQDHSFALLPLSTNYQPTAALGIFFENRQGFSKDEITFMLTLARQGALAYERAKLFEKEREARIETESIEKLLQQVYNSSIKFLIPLTPDEIYRTIVEEAMKLTNADYGSIFLLKNQKLERVYTNFPTLYPIKPRGNGFTKSAFKSRQTLINIITEDEFHKELLELGIKIGIYIPLSYYNKAIGVINILSLKKNVFLERELEVLKIYGSLATLALSRIKPQ